ncbi:MAG: class I SAM-dependent methyltransferase [Armatimonadetes bacterium]|nr:class I SAM-dependent methyltransferase [Armatimonadota bacterium]
MTKTTPNPDVLGPSCNVCGGDGVSFLVSKNGYRVYQCRSCGFAFTHPQPECLSDQYDSGYFDLYQKRRKFRLKRSVARLKQIELIIPPGRLLDIGCSLGYFVEAANARGWQASGIDISKYAAQEARKLGLNVFSGTVEGFGFPEESFDCVTMWDVLEHVPDPTAHMLEVRRIIAPGGLVVIGTPDLGHPAFRIKRERWRHLKPAEHINYFCRSSIRRLLVNTGFDIVTPPIFGGRYFTGSLCARLRAIFSRLVQLNDVMVVYACPRSSPVGLKQV